MAYGSNPTGVQLLLNLRNDSDYDLLCFTFVGLVGSSLIIMPPT